MLLDVLCQWKNFFGKEDTVKIKNFSCSPEDWVSEKRHEK